MSYQFHNSTDVKSQAKLLKQALQEKFSIELKLSDCFELISRSHGLKDWNTLSALAKRQSDSAICEGTPNEPLTVRQLIETLKTYDPESPVSITREILEASHPEDESAVACYTTVTTREFWVGGDAKAGPALVVPHNSRSGRMAVSAGRK